MFHQKFLQPTQPKSPFNIRGKTELSAVLHGILVDGMIERIESNPEFVNAEVVCLRAQGVMPPNTFSVLEATMTFTRRIGQKGYGG